MMRKLIIRIIFSILLFGFVSAYAKIIDPAPIEDGDMKYESHDNYVEAFDSKSDKLIWKTIVYEAGYIGKFNPNLEADVQWNAIQTIKLLGSLIYIRNARGQEFHLNKVSGKIQAR
jgi:hypothetical protein